MKKAGTPEYTKELLADANTLRMILDSLYPHRRRLECVDGRNCLFDGGLTLRDLQRQQIFSPLNVVTISPCRYTSIRESSILRLIASIYCNLGVIGQWTEFIDNFWEPDGPFNKRAKRRYTKSEYASYVKWLTKCSKAPY